MPIPANIIQQAFSPLITVFEEILVFIHAHLVGSSWGLAIVMLTVLIRAILVPVTYRQLKSMQEMQRLAPQMSAIKEKYKEDKQRQQQEIMKFYKEHKINPLASCLPFALQLPVFISLFYMLRTDLKFDICGPQLREYYSRELHRPITSNSQIPEHAVKVMGQTVKGLTETGCNVVAPGSAKFLFIPDITYKATGAVLIVLIALYIASQIASTLMATASADPNQRRLMLALPLVIVAFLFRYPAGLLVYWITTNCWTIGQQYFIRRHMGPAPPVAGKESGAGGIGALLGRKPDQPLSGGGAPKGEPALVGAGGGANGAAAATPPRPPRKKKKRSGRRR
jgi:YidC/Oxa1 family membrane protein insertase